MVEDTDTEREAAGTESGVVDTESEMADRASESVGKEAAGTGPEIRAAADGAEVGACPTAGRCSEAVAGTLVDIEVDAVGSTLHCVPSRLLYF